MDPTTYEIRPIPGCPGYLAGADGTIWSAMRGSKPASKARWASLHALRSYRSKGGYRRVSLRCNNERRGYLVHTLVASAFHGLRPDGLVVCHRNGINTDNRAENLVYRTQADNIAERDAHGTTVRGERSHLAKLTEGQAIEILRRLRNGETQAALAREFEIGVATIWGLKTGRTWRHLSAASEGTIQ